MPPPRTFRTSHHSWPGPCQPVRQEACPARRGTSSPVEQSTLRAPFRETRRERTEQQEQAAAASVLSAPPSPSKLPTSGSSPGRGPASTRGPSPVASRPGTRLGFPQVSPTLLQATSPCTLPPGGSGCGATSARRQLDFKDPAWRARARPDPGEPGCSEYIPENSGRGKGRAREPGPLSLKSGGARVRCFPLSLFCSSSVPQLFLFYSSSAPLLLLFLPSFLSPFLLSLSFSPRPLLFPDLPFLTLLLP